MSHNLSQCDELVVLMVTAPDGPMRNKWLRMEGGLGLDHNVQRIKRAEHFLLIKDFLTFFLFMWTVNPHTAATRSSYMLVAATRYYSVYKRTTVAIISCSD